MAPTTLPRQRYVLPSSIYLVVRSPALTWMSNYSFHAVLSLYHAKGRRENAIMVAPSLSVPTPRCSRQFRSCDGANHKLPGASGAVNVVACRRSPKSVVVDTKISIDCPNPFPPAAPRKAFLWVGFWCSFGVLVFLQVAEAVEGSRNADSDAGKRPDSAGKVAAKCCVVIYLHPVVRMLLLFESKVQGMPLKL
eukprot:1723368-Amphidinium_carterae.1